MPPVADAAIIVPSFNRPDRLRQCLDALVRQRGIDYQILVVDDGSSTPLAAVCEQFGDRVHYIRQNNAGPAAARNRGARATRARFLAFTDDDCRPDPCWLTALMAAQADDPLRLVGGAVHNGLTENRYAEASQALCDYLYEYFGATTGDMPFFTSNNIGCDRQVFERLGGFDESFPLAAAEDREFGIRWREAGGQLIYSPHAVVHHFHALTLRSFLRQHGNYGRGARHLHRRLAARQSTAPRYEPLRFYTGLIRHPLRERGRYRLSLSALLFMSQLAMVRGYAAEGIRRPQGGRNGSAMR